MNSGFIIMYLFMGFLAACFAYVFLHAAFGFTPEECSHVVNCQASESYFINGTVNGKQVNASYTITPGFSDKGGGCAFPGENIRADLNCNGKRDDREWLEYAVRQGKYLPSDFPSGFEKPLPPFKEDLSKQAPEGAIKTACDRNPEALKDNPHCIYVWKLLGGKIPY